MSISNMERVIKQATVERVELVGNKFKFTHEVDPQKLVSYVVDECLSYVREYNIDQDDIDKSDSIKYIYHAIASHYNIQDHFS